MILESNSNRLHSPKCNLLIFSDDPCVGGVARHADILCRGLAGDSHFSANWFVTHAIAIPMSNGCHPYIEAQRRSGVNIKIIDIDPIEQFNETMTLGAYAQAISETMPHLIVFEDSCPISNLAAKIEASKLKIPFICVEHMVQPYMKEQFAGLEPYVKRFFAEAAQIITVSDHSKKMLHKYFVSAGKPIEVIWNGVEQKFFDNPKTHATMPPGCIRVLSVGQFNAAKRFVEWHDVVSRIVKQKYKTARFSWLSSTEPPNFIPPDGSGFDPVPPFPVVVDEVVRVDQINCSVETALNTHHLFFMPSLYEGMPFAAIEAIAKGLFCLVSENCNIPDVIPHTAIIVKNPSGDIEERFRFYPKLPLVDGVVTLFAKKRDALEVPLLWAIRWVEEFYRDFSSHRMAAKQYFTAEAMVQRYAAEFNSIELHILNPLTEGYYEDGDRAVQVVPAFPFLAEGDEANISWEFFNKGEEFPPFLVDRRLPDCGMLDFEEVAILKRAARQYKGQTALEIGSFVGWSTLQLWAAGVNVVAIDPTFSAPWNTILGSMKLLGVPDDEITLIYGSSPTVFSVYKQLYDNRFPLIFIDGDHEGQAPYLDLLAAKPFAADDHTFIFHDCDAPGVKLAIQKLKDEAYFVIEYDTRQKLTICTCDPDFVPPMVKDVAYKLSEDEGSPPEPFHPIDMPPAFKIESPDSFLDDVLSINIMPPEEIRASHFKDNALLFDATAPVEHVFAQIFEIVEPYTMVPQQRLFSLFTQVKRVIDNNIDGDIIECGVCRGGSALLIALTMSIYEPNSGRRLILFDTWEGLPEPTAEDITAEGRHANEVNCGKGALKAELSEVENLLAETLPDRSSNILMRVDFVKGDVTETFSSAPVGNFAFVHADLDWYEGTKFLLGEVWPYLAVDGSIQVDDYHYWIGCEKACNEFFWVRGGWEAFAIADVGGVVFFKAEPTANQVPAITTPVVLFAYNRPEHTAEVCRAIATASPMKLYVVQDGDRVNDPKVKAVHAVIKKILSETKTDVVWITKHSEVQPIGMVANFKRGLDTVFNEMGEAAAIILEDDVVPTQDFFQFVQNALREYQDHDDIFHVSGSNFLFNQFLTTDEEVEAGHYLSAFPHVWGWGTWARCWSSDVFDMSAFEPSDRIFDELFPSSRYFKMPNTGKAHWQAVFQHLKENPLNTWDYAWVFHLWYNSAFSITPTKNLTRNIGFDGSGTHPAAPEWAEIYSTLEVGRCKFKAIFTEPLAVNAIADTWYQNAIVMGNLEAVNKARTNAPHEQIAIKQSLDVAPAAPSEADIIAILTPPPFFASETDRYNWCHSVEILVDWAASNTADPKLAECRALIATKLNMIPFYLVEMNILSQMQSRATLLQAVLKDQYPELDLEHEFAVKEHPSRRNYRTHPFKLGILSESFTSDSETRALLPYFDIDDDELWVMAIAHQVCPVPHPLEGMVRDRSSHFVVIADRPLDEAIGMIRDLDLDALLIGSNITAVSNWTAMLACAQLAPYTFVDRNSPVTTGFQFISGYISSSLLPSMQEMYSEKVVQLDTVAQCFYIPEDVPSETFNPAEALGVSDDDFILYSGANFHKLSIPLLHAWADILTENPTAILVLNPFGANWSAEYPTAQFLQFLNLEFRNTPGVLGRIKVLEKPLNSRSEYLRLLTYSDLYLDGYPFSGATSLMDAVVCGLPVCTRTSRLIDRAATGAMYATIFGWEGLIAKNWNEYTQLATKFIREKSFRDLMAESILNSTFEVQQWQTQIKEFLRRVA